jgi:phosphate transport system protein
MSSHTDKAFESDLRLVREKLLAMGAKVEEQIAKSMRSLTDRDSELGEQVKEADVEINRLEVDIDELCRKILALRQPAASDLRLITTALKIVTDLERIGDLAVNLAECVISLRETPAAQLPEELAPMATAVRAMVSKSLGALIFRNVEMAGQVLQSDDVVDQYRDRIFDQLLQSMTQQAALVSPGMQFILATRHLERIADHATNIAEDIIFWVRGLDVRHGRGLPLTAESGEQAESEGTEVMENSQALHSGVTPDVDTRGV